MSGIRDLVKLINAVDPELLAPVKRRRAARVDIDPEQVFDILFMGATEGRKLWKGTSFGSALQLCNSYALLISLAIPEMAEVKFLATFAKFSRGESPAAFEVRYILGGKTMRRIVEPADTARARASVDSSVEDCQR